MKILLLAHLRVFSHRYNKRELKIMNRSNKEHYLL